MADQLEFGDLVDLHQHLGSSSTAHFLWELAHEQGIRLPEKNYWKFLDLVTVNNRTTYNKYLKFFDLTELIQSSPYAVERSAHQAVSSSYRKSNINLVEIRFNPMLRNKKGEHDLDKIIFAALVGMKKAMIEYPVKAGIILMMDRRFSQKKNEIIVEKAIKFRNEGVVGLDLGGPLNKNFSLDDIKESTARAKTAGLGITIHTGEATPAEEVWEVINTLNPDRIGHGIKAVSNPTLLREIVRRNIVLEICPTSNIRTNVVKTWKEMKNIFLTLKQYGVLFTINSDGPQLLQTNVKKELQLLYEKKILTKKEIKKAIAVARNSTFIKSSL